MTKQFTVNVEQMFELITTALKEMIPVEYQTEETIGNYRIQVFGMIRYMQRVPNITREVFIDKLIADIKDILNYAKDIPEIACFEGLDLNECIRLVYNREYLLRQDLKKLDDELYQLLGCNDFDGYLVMFNQGMAKLRAAASTMFNVEEGESFELVVDYEWCDGEEYQLTISWGTLGIYSVC